MIIKYNTEELKRIIDNIFEITGVSLSVLDTEYNSLTRHLGENDFCSFLQSDETERLNCRACDKKILEKCKESKRLEKHVCKSGLYDAALPIIKDEAMVGFVLIGRVRSVNSPKSPTNLPTSDPRSVKKFEALYDALPFISESRLDALYDLLAFIIFDSAIQIIYDPILTDVLDYINSSFTESLSIDSLCSKFHVSKNRLYKIFSENLNATVNEYVTECRLKRAKYQLSHSDESVYKIAQSVGIDNYTYFCRLFKKANGLTPTEYRKHSKVRNA